MIGARSSVRVATGGGPSRPPSNTLGHRIANSPWTSRLIVLAIIAVIWETYARIADKLLVPTFSATVVGVVQLIGDPVIWAAFLASNQTLVVGFALSALLGVVLGLGIARYRRLEGVVDPYLNILLVTPMAALIPILLMSLGFGLASRVVLVIVFSIPVIIVNTRAGVRQVDPNLIEMATSFGAREREIWWKILLPAALPAIMTGIRLGLGRGVTGMVIIELLMIAVGIGDLILIYRGKFQAALLYGVAVLVVVEALALISLARAVERRVAPWASTTALRE